MGQVQLLCAVRVRVDAQHAAKVKRSAVPAPVQIQAVRIGVDLDSNFGWLVYDLTHSALALGLVGLATFLPAIALALVTGHVADRFDRRLIVAACHALNALAAAGLLAVAWTGGGVVAPIYLLAVLFGVARAFAGPASQALVPGLVPREQFAQAIAWNSSLWQGSSIAGPALGGLLYALGPA